MGSWGQATTAQAQERGRCCAARLTQGFPFCNTGRLDRCESCALGIPGQRNGAIHHLAVGLVWLVARAEGGHRLNAYRIAGVVALVLELARDAVKSANVKIE
jgi:hypothetical protein